MQIRDRQAVRKPDPPPNGGMNVPQQELQPQQQRRALFDHHPTLQHHAGPCPWFVMGSIGLTALVKGVVVDLRLRRRRQQMRRNAGTAAQPVRGGSGAGSGRSPAGSMLTPYFQFCIEKCQSSHS